MARNGFPVMKTDGGVLSKVIGWAVALALLTLVIKHPGDAATWAKSLFGMLGNAIEGISTFLRYVLG